MQIRGGVAVSLQPCHPHQQPPSDHSHTHNAMHRQELQATLHYKRTLFTKWRRHAAELKAARLQQQRREEAALLACNPALGVAGTRRRGKGKAGAVVAVTNGSQGGASAAAAHPAPRRSAREYDLIAQQQMKRRRRAEEEEAALGDHAPLDLPRLLAACLPHALTGLQAPPTAAAVAATSGAGAGAAAPPAPERVFFKLLVSSGWSDAGSVTLAPPPFQRSRAGWLRHKLCLGLNRALPGGAHIQQLTPPAAAAAAVAQQQQQQQQHAPAQQAVYALPCGAEVLTLLELQGHMAGRRVVLGLEVVDASAAALVAQQQEQQMDGAAAQEQEGCVEGVFVGASGVLLLVSGAAEHEVAAAVGRLAVLLKRLPPGAAVPVGFLTCSGETEWVGGWGGLLTPLCSIPHSRLFQPRQTPLNHNHNPKQNPSPSPSLSLPLTPHCPTPCASASQPHTPPAWAACTTTQQRRQHPLTLCARCWSS